MNELITTYKKMPFALRALALSCYIALVNSYALFIVYPIIKTGDALAIVTSLVVYAGMTVPLLLHILHIQTAKPRRMIMITGLLVLIAATVFQFLTAHTSVPVLLLHAGFYLFAGLVEESLWRGKLWQLVSQKLKHPAAVLAIVTAHFVVLHIPFAVLEKQDALGFLIQVLALGIALGVLRIISKRVSVPAFAHAAINMVVYT